MIRSQGRRSLGLPALKLGYITRFAILYFYSEKSEVYSSLDGHMDGWMAQASSSGKVINILARVSRRMGILALGGRTNRAM